MKKYIIGSLVSFVLTLLSMLCAVFYMWEVAISTDECHDIYVKLYYASEISFLLFVVLFLYCLVKIIMMIFKKPPQDKTPATTPEN